MGLFVSELLKFRFLKKEGIIEKISYEPMSR